MKVLFTLRRRVNKPKVIPAKAGIQASDSA
jgi:hypothetical protein